MSITVLGIDTSNYTTSVAVVTDGVVRENIKIPVFVNNGEKGVRQSDAVFSHVKNLPIAMEKIEHLPKVDGVGYSGAPRDCEGSYMPCFLTGEALARGIAKTHNVKAIRCSHQAGHVMAALYSTQKQELLNERFAAFHVSGGTTEILLVEPGMKITKIGGTIDLTAGQAIDRIGVMLDLSFPCGAALEQLALKGKIARDKICVNGLECNLSGLENKAKQMLQKGVSSEDIAAYTIEFVRRTLCKMSENLRQLYPNIPIVYAGGVMSCQIIRRDFEKRFHASFAEPAFSCDNATGVALIGYNKLLEEIPNES
jgi:N6-L-threonylcarbamoyladenine synthase